MEPLRIGKTPQELILLQNIIPSKKFGPPPGELGAIVYIHLSIPFSIPHSIPCSIPHSRQQMPR